MNDDLEQLLQQQRPRNAPSLLRGRILASIEDELNKRAEIPVSWERLTGRLVATALVLGFASNQWALQSSERRLAEFVASKPVPLTVSGTVESVRSVASPELAEKLCRQLSSSYEQQRRVRQIKSRQLEQFIHDLEIFQQEIRDVKTQEVSEKDRNRRRSSNRDSADRQRCDGHDLYRTV